MFQFVALKNVFLCACLVFYFVIFNAPLKWILFILLSDEALFILINMGTDTQNPNNWKRFCATTYFFNVGSLSLI